MQAHVEEFNLVLVGSGGVGKTTFVEKLKTGMFEGKYKATVGSEIKTIRVETTKGPIQFNVCDTCGQEVRC